MCREDPVRESCPLGGILDFWFRERFFFQCADTSFVTCMLCADKTH